MMMLLLFGIGDDQVAPPVASNDDDARIFARARLGMGIG